MAAATPGSLQRQTFASLAVESWVRARDGAAALKILAEEKVPNASFWQAQAKVLAGDLESAEKLLISRVRDNQATSQERLLLAQVSLTHDNTTQARQVLEPLRHSPDAEIARHARLIWDEMELRTGNMAPAVADLASPENAKDVTARLLHAQGLVDLDRQAEAQTKLREILGSTGGGESVHHAASVLLADSLLRQGQRPQAVEVLVQFLDNTTASDYWSTAFDLLARCLETKDNALLPPDATLRWITEGNTVQREALPALASTSIFQGHAMLLLSRWLVAQGRTQEALGLLEAMIQVHSGHPQSDEAMRLALETYGTIKASSRITALADLWRQRFGGNGSSMVDFVTASTAFTQGDYKQAAELFQTAANLATNLAERRSALYNAGISALRAGEIALYQSLLGQLQVVTADTAVPTKDGAADLELDRALDLAAKGKTEAEAELRAFTEKQPRHPRAVEAFIALAEVALLRVPTDFPFVERVLKSAESVTGLTDKQRQRIIITRLWQLDRQGQLKTLTETGTDFLKTWPTAEQAAMVRMKVADAYFRLENFAAARTEFELVSKEHPNSAFADTAHYFAGMSALSMMSDEGREAAINLWQELAERGGPLSIPARQQQALAKRRAGQETEAVKLLDSLLSEKRLPEELKRSLSCEKAEILMLLGKADVSQLTAAIDILRGLLKEDDLPYKWRARVGYTLAVALNSAGRGAEALEACHDVVQAIGFSEPSDPSEFRWYYRAGFFGIDLLETTKQWESAARLAEKLASSKGDRAVEAKERATKIRLEHFLWDGK
jgi:tetratricopeptide (TPR) repeat protein